MADFLFVMSYEINSINLLVLPEVFFLFNFFFLFIRFVINNFFKNVIVSDYYNCFILVLLGVLILKCCNGYFMLTWVDCSGMLFSDLKSVVYSFFFFFCLFLFSILARFFYKFEFLLVEFFFLVWICLIGLSFFFFVNDFILFFFIVRVS